MPLARVGVEDQFVARASTETAWAGSLPFVRERQSLACWSPRESSGTWPSRHWPFRRNRRLRSRNAGRQARRGKGPERLGLRKGRGHGHSPKRRFSPGDKRDAARGSDSRRSGLRPGRRDLLARSVAPVPRGTERRQARNRDVWSSPLAKKPFQPQNRFCSPSQSTRSTGLARALFDAMTLAIPAPWNRPKTVSNDSDSQRTEASARPLRSLLDSKAGPRQASTLPTHREPMVRPRVALHDRTIGPWLPSKTELSDRHVDRAPCPARSPRRASRESGSSRIGSASLARAEPSARTRVNGWFAGLTSVMVQLLTVRSAPTHENRHVCAAGNSPDVDDEVQRVQDQGLALEHDHSRLRPHRLQDGRSIRMIGRNPRPRTEHAGLPRNRGNR